MILKSKIHHLTAALLLSVFAVSTSCTGAGDVENESVSVAGLDEVVNFEAVPESAQAFAIESNVSWTITIKDLDWLSVSRLKGKAGRYEITMTASENAREERSGELTVQAGSVKKTVTVTQSAGEFTPKMEISASGCRLEAFGGDPFTIKVDSNVDWTLSTEDLNWADISPVSGRRDRQTTVTIAPHDNFGKERSGRIKFSAEGLQDSYFSVVQEKLSTSLIIEGVEGSLLSFPAEGGTKTIQIKTNVKWQATNTGTDWIEVSPASGEGSLQLEAQEVKVTAADNSGAPRSAKVTFTATEDDSIEPVEVNVEQEAFPDEVLIAQWTMTAAYVKSASVDQKGANFTNPIKADLPAGTQATATWVSVNGDNSSYMLRGNVWASTLDKSGQVQGHYLIKPVWTGDYYEIVIPGMTIAAGAKVTMRLGLNSQGGPVLYTVKYLDGGEWKMTDKVTYTPPAPYEPIETTLILSYKQQYINNIEQTAVFSNPIVNGDIVFRIECTDGRFQSLKGTGKNELTICTTKNTGAIIRLCPWNFDEEAGNVGMTFHLSY
ncbi:MAG: BACON domain-containing protein [Candidatus Cryptobacteroides sp.]